MSTSERVRPPAPLLVAAALVAIEGLVVAVLGVLELAALDSDRVSMGVTVALFFLGLGAGLVLCARGLQAVRSWARGPVVAAQLITLLTGFSFWGGETTATAVGLIAVSVATLACVLNPASTRALAAAEE